MVFRNTQIGFKRLLRTTNVKHRPIQINVQTNIISLIEIPNQYELKDLIVKVQDPWGVNMQRVNSLVIIIKKWNQFHMKLNTLMFDKENQLNSFLKLNKYLNKYHDIISSYQRIFQTEIYEKIVQSLEGAQTNLLIDDQLNKVAKLFLKSHCQLSCICKQIDAFIQKMTKISQNIEKLSQKISQQEDSAAFFAQSFNVVDENISTLVLLSKNTPSLYEKFGPILISIFQNIITNLQMNQVQGVIFTKISFYNLCKSPQQYEIIFQIITSIYTKLVKIIEGLGENHLNLNLIYERLKSMKQITNHLWNVSKYFNKLKKQIESKKNNQKVKIIENFLSFYSNYKTQFQIMSYKNIGRLQKEINQFKNKISKLKNQIQTE